MSGNDTDEETERVSPREAAAEAAPAGSAKRPNKIGRFTVIEKIGRGGMGVVYAAYDPELDRRVAVKLLHAGGGTEARLRLSREAQAVAKISHPNVVQVYEVGTLGERVFMAMEFVAGRTLGKWFRAAPGGWRAVLDVMVQAGRGLAAAHAAGIVHRDFKPGNVLVGDDGRVRVLDFGLARAPGEKAASTSGPTQLDSQETATGLLSGPLTETGVVMGTPAYMAPEQYVGAVADARSDQYSFCVTAYEALYGERPFQGEDRTELRKKVMLGKRPEPPRDSPVPAWVSRVVLRGLSREPDDRYPDMESLLSELSRDPVAARRRRLAYAGVAAALLGGGLGVGYLSRSGESLCVDAQTRVERVWNAERSRAIEGQFSASELAFAADSFAAADAILDDYTARWAGLYEEVCAAASDPAIPGRDRVFEQMACLEGRIAQVDALAGLLETADARLIERARWAVGALRPPEGCMADVVVETEPQLDPVAQEHRQRRLTHLAEARALVEAADFEKAKPRLEQLLDEARADEDHEVEANVLVHLATVAIDRGDHAEAEDQLYAAVTAARAGGHARPEARAWISLVTLVGYHERRPKDAHRLSELAEAAIRLAPVRDDLEAHRLHAEANVLLGEGKYDEARERYEETLGYLRGEGDQGALEAAKVESSLGIALRRAGRFDEALEASERAATRLRTLLGDHHPDVARAVMNVGSVHLEASRHEPAIAAYEEALRIFEASGASQLRLVGMSSQNLGEALRFAGELERAEPHYRRALEIYEQTYGPEHSQTAGLLTGLAELLRSTDRPREARETAAEALRIKQATLGAEHPSLITTLLLLGDLDLDRGELTPAGAYFERARAITAASLGDEHPRMASLLWRIGEVQLRRGELDAAAASLEQGLALEDAMGEGWTLGHALRFSLAKTRYAQREHEQGRALARTALEGYASAGPGHARERDEVVAWLADHAR